jgi:hypothetical protein
MWSISGKKARGETRPGRRLCVLSTWRPCSRVAARSGSAHLRSSHDAGQDSALSCASGEARHASSNHGHRRVLSSSLCPLLTPDGITARSTGEIGILKRGSRDELIADPPACQCETDGRYLALFGRERNGHDEMSSGFFFVSGLCPRRRTAPLEHRGAKKIFRQRRSFLLVPEHAFLNAQARDLTRTPAHRPARALSATDSWLLLHPFWCLNIFHNPMSGTACIRK